jgi:hypothetical protein
MTELLEQAFAEAARRPEEEQDAIAGWLLDELRSEQQWLERFDASADTLQELIRNDGRARAPAVVVTSRAPAEG